MNICFIHSSEEKVWGGAENWVLANAAGLQKLGHQVVIAGSENSLFLKKYASTGFKILPLQFSSWQIPLNIWKLKKFFQKYRIQVVVTQLLRDTRLTVYSARLAGVAVHCVRHGNPLLSSEKPLPIFNRQVNGIIINSHSTEIKYRSLGWLQQKNLRVIHNGMEIRHPVRSKRSEMLQAFGVPADRPLLGWFGPLVPDKKPLTAIKVLAAVKRFMPEAALLFVGDGPLRGYLDEHISRWGLENSVFFLGPQFRVLEIYHACEAVMLTTLKEGIPNAVLESMLAGTPAVAFDNGGVRELITTAEVGIIVEPENIDKMVAQVLDLLWHPQRRKQMGCAAREYIARNFSAESMVDQVEDFFYELYENRKNS
ncbi:MAG: glycosyltransferase family 4 protein [Calditrichia bacterium]